MELHQSKQPIPFFKYQGTGNDFILLDHRTEEYLSIDDQPLIKHLCDRRMGIGADGLIMLKNHKDYDFEMVYFNSDGRTSSMCGNGGRCMVAFAKALGIIDNQCSFLAIDGPHEATVEENGWVALKMMDTQLQESSVDHAVLDTGSPHYVVFVEDLDDIDIIENAQAIRYSAPYKKEGINVNFVEQKPEHIEVATYERGVEGETLSCGTGVTAAAIAHALRQNFPANQSLHVPIKTKGGDLEIRLSLEESGRAHQVWLCGPAERVFEGVW